MQASIENQLIGQVPNRRRILPRVSALCMAAAACLSAPGASAAVAPAGKSVPVAPTPKWPFAVATPKAKDAGQGGIGVVLEARPTGVFAREVVPGGAAHRAGVLAGDQFARVDAWIVPADAKVPDVAEKVRGKAGTSCEVEFKRQGQAVVLTLQRAPMERMFPPLSKAPLVIRAGYALAATGSKHTLGVRFVGEFKPGLAGQYQWAMIEGDQALGAPGSQTGSGVVTVDPQGGATVQVADWKLDLKSRADGTVMVAASNLPVHEVAGDWLQVAPPFASLVKPRTDVVRKVLRWDGPARLALALQEGGKPLAQQRVTLRLADGAGQAQETQTCLSDKDGIVQVPVPSGLYRIQGLAPSVAGAGRDVSLSFDLPPQGDRVVQAGDPKPAALQLVAKPAPATTQPLDWSTDPRVGQGLPELAVQRWFGLDKAPTSLEGKVLFIDLWATWCGPCRATAPQVYELHSRMASKGLVVVAASIDRDELALEEYVREMLPGAPPVAWVGTDAMETLETESVPTFFVVDHLGRIRGVHKGTGWSLDAAEKWLQSLLDEAKPTRKK